MIYLTLRMAEPLFRVLGRTGIQVLERVLGLVLAGIAVQFVLEGLRAAGIMPAGHRDAEKASPTVFGLVAFRQRGSVGGRLS